LNFIKTLIDLYEKVSVVCYDYTRRVL
jgi:hypothetical protein